MKQEVLGRIKHRKLGELFEVSIYDSTMTNKDFDKSISSKFLIKNKTKSDNILIAIYADSFKVEIINIESFHSTNCSRKNDNGLIILHPKISIIDYSTIKIFLESKYGSLQLHEILCRKIIDIHLLEEIIIPIFPLFFEEKIERVCKEIDIEKSKDILRSRKIHNYAISLIEKYIEKQAKSD